MFQVTGLDGFRNSLEAALARQVGRINHNYRLFVIDVLSELVENTPQWSGDLAASWRVAASGVTQRTGGTNKSPFKADPYEYPAPHFRGDKEALDYVLYTNSSVIDSIRYNTHVTIFNANKTGQIIDNPWMEELWLRPGNFIAGDVMAIAHTIAKFNHGNIALRGT